MLRSIQMSPTEFIQNIPDNPIQRDTKRHATTYSRPGGHLEKFHPTHLRVAIAETKDKKKRWKLDGHSRAFLWEQGSLELPANKLMVDVYTVEGEQEAMDYYLCFDADGSHETGNDKLHGAFRFHKFNPTHPTMFKETGLIAAMNYLIFERKWGQLKHLSYVQKVKPWIRTLKQIDSMEKFYNTTRFPSPWMAAMLCTVRRDGAEALEFWQRYHNDEGTKATKTMDGVHKAGEVLFEFKNPLLTETRHQRGLTTRRITDFTPKVIYCYDAFVSNRRIPIKVQRGQRIWDGMLAVPEWWQDNLGEYDHPEMRDDSDLFD